MSPRMAAALAAIPANYRAELEAAYGEDNVSDEPVHIAAAITSNTRTSSNTKIGGSSKPATKPAEHTPPNQYCYLHGYNRSHDGMGCRVMLNDAAYTTTMKKARTHDAPALKSLKLVGSTRTPFIRK